MGTCLSCLTLLRTGYTNYSPIENRESSRSNEPEYSRQFQFDHSDRTSDVESTWQNFPPPLGRLTTDESRPSLQYFVGQDIAPAEPTLTRNPDELCSNGFENIP